MKMVVEFDIDADIIDVPQFVVDQREKLRRQFLKWLNNKSVKHQYWVRYKSNGNKEIVGLRYRSDAFVEWLNKKILVTTEETARVLEEKCFDYSDDLPKIFF